jgi:hypothetical protein
MLFQVAIVLCYSRQIIVKVANRVPPPFTWHIYQIIVDCLSHIVIACVLNQSNEHQLLNDVMNSTISMVLKLKFYPLYGI